MSHGYVYELLRKLGLSAFQANTGEFLLVRPLKIAVMLVAAAVLGRIAGRGARRFVRGLHRRSPLLLSSPRAEQRAATVGDVLASIVRGVIWSITLLLVLDQVGVDLAPLLAGAGIAGLAIGFGAQSLVKDFLAGLFILLEDQYGVGDTVTLSETTGTVEDVTLRITRLRSVDGTVWYVPNGEVRKVGNASMEWSRAIVDVLVPYEADLAQVQSAIRAAADDLAADPDWADDLLEPPEVWGVQATSPDGRTVRVVAKAAPRRQPAVARELRGRITERFRTEHLPLPRATTTP
ncbi:MAG: moderate conductance mechanosensitive channel [Acidimicrobiaceae bacterium]|nr:moderate conductance mechanosensitive channel [Acidimicrobiaceae bacterium]